MGDPRKIRSKFKGPRHPWQGERIQQEKKLLEEFGLKNKRELWRMRAVLRGFSDQAKKLTAATGSQVDKEKDEFVKFTKADLIHKLLPTIDTFEIALRNTKDKEKFVKGMEMVYAQLYSTLEAEGLRPIEALGKKIDPYLHEVMLKQKSDKEEGIILEEIQKGYMLNDKVLRHSKVKISEKVKDDKKEKNIK